MTADETKMAGTVSEELGRLLKRRATIRGWLQRLEGKKDDVRPDVYRRVEEDYRQRLRKVHREMEDHRSDLEAAVDDRLREVKELEDRRDEYLADMEEVELRHAVGEYSQERRDREREEHDEAMAELDGRLDEERQIADRLGRILEGLSAGDDDGEGPADIDEIDAEDESVKGLEDVGDFKAVGEPAGVRQESDDVDEEDLEGVQDLEDLEDLEDLDDLEGLEDLDELDFLEALDDPAFMDTLALDLEEEEGEDAEEPGEARRGGDDADEGPEEAGSGKDQG